MKPPHCYVCGLDMWDIPDDDALNKHFTLVYFAISEAEEEYQRRRDEEGWVGHPNEAVWFCRKHVDVAERRKHLHWTVALAEINAEIERG